jgi:hypothetical protein
MVMQLKMVVDTGQMIGRDSQLIMAMWFKKTINFGMCIECNKDRLNVNLQKSQESKQWKNIYFYTV